MALHIGIASRVLQRLSKVVLVLPGMLFRDLHRCFWIVSINNAVAQSSIMRTVTQKPKKTQRIPVSNVQRLSLQ